jgi:hypothetical protein
MKLITEDPTKRITPKSEYLLRLEARQQAETALAEVEAERAAVERDSENARLLGREVIYPPNNVLPIRR